MGSWELFGGLSWVSLYNNTATIAFDVKASDICIIGFSFEGYRIEIVGEFVGGVESFRGCEERDLECGVTRTLILLLRVILGGGWV